MVIIILILDYQESAEAWTLQTPEALFSFYQLVRIVRKIFQNSVMLAWANIPD